MPTNHGFDEFFGNFYHLNAEEEPEGYYYPKDPAFREQYGPRGVIHSTADGEIEDTGPLTRERMETVDEEFLTAATDFMDRAHEQERPLFMWFNSTRMHIWTHLRDETNGVTGVGLYPDGMVELDNYIGELLDKLDELGIADNTMWTFVPIQQKIREFFATIPDYPYQTGSSLSASNLGYQTLRNEELLERLQNVESVMPAARQ